MDGRKWRRILEFKDFKKAKSPLRGRRVETVWDSLMKGIGFWQVLLAVGHPSPVPVPGN